MTHSDLKKVVDSYMEQVPEVSAYCDRCLRTDRWNGSVVLMIVDASFTSLGLNYFQAVVPNVAEFKRRFIECGVIQTVEDLATADIEQLRAVWRNKRSWAVAKAIASYLAKIKQEMQVDDRAAFRFWAKNTSLEKWEEDPIGTIRGVGITTFQYLRMMAGIDTVMPDKIVKRVMEEIFANAGSNMPGSDRDLINKVEQVAKETGYRAIELCWMTWLIQSEAGSTRITKYAHLLPLI